MTRIQWAKVSGQEISTPFTRARKDHPNSPPPFVHLWFSLCYGKETFGQPPLIFYHFRTYVEAHLLFFFLEKEEKKKNCQTTYPTYPLTKLWPLPTPAPNSHIIIGPVRPSGLWKPWSLQVSDQRRWLKFRPSFFPLGQKKRWSLSGLNAMLRGHAHV